MTSVEEPKLTKKDYKSDQDVRWCPGCGDYAILNSVQSAFAKLGKRPHETVIISGIGCSSRFPYYMETYGFHTIHGRAPALATGVKISNPELDVWVITGDGDAMSIGGNHFIHAMRRNVGLKVLMFNNRIYGLTKGQFSPTSEHGKVTKSSPLGSVDFPFSPIALALGAGSSFVARGIDILGPHLESTVMRADAHDGTAMVEIYQNCNIFNDGAYKGFTDKTVRDERMLYPRTRPAVVVRCGHRDQGHRVRRPVSAATSSSGDDLVQGLRLERAPPIRRRRRWRSRRWSEERRSQCPIGVFRRTDKANVRARPSSIRLRQAEASRQADAEATCCTPARVWDVDLRATCRRFGGPGERLTGRCRQPPAVLSAFAANECDRQLHCGDQTLQLLAASEPSTALERRRCCSRPLDRRRRSRGRCRTAP